MEHLIWAGAVSLVAIVVIVGFRKSWSKIIQGIKLRKAAGLEFEQVPQQQIEEGKADSKLTPLTPVREQNETDDPVLAPKIRLLRDELDNLSRNSLDREKVLLRSVAIWQVNHENERMARHIFGSQLEILLLLNARPAGEPLENIRAIYDRAVQNFSTIYRSYTFEPYIGFLKAAQFVADAGDQLVITPRGKAFLHYLVTIGDTLPRQG